jgi:hypothetical protein
LGTVVHVDFGRSTAIELSKRQLSRHPEIRRSTRWIEQRMAEGMPSHMDGHRRMFNLDRVREWLAAHGKTTIRSANG